MHTMITITVKLNPLFQLAINYYEFWDERHGRMGACYRHGYDSGQLCYTLLRNIVVHQCYLERCMKCITDWLYAISFCVSLRHGKSTSQ